MYVALTNSDLVALVDDIDSEKVSGYKWYLHSEGYAAAPTYENGVPGTVYMHKLIKPDVPFVDHRDRNKLNNQRGNLREATRAQNGGNRSKSPNTSSKFKGVHWDSECKKWAAMLQVRVNGKRKVMRLGRHSEEVAAAKAYNEAALNHFGEFALLNNV